MNLKTCLVLRKACPLLSALSAILSLFSGISSLLSLLHPAVRALLPLHGFRSAPLGFFSVSPHLLSPSSLQCFQPVFLPLLNSDLYFCLMPSFLAFCTFQEIRSHGIAKVHNNFKHKFESNIKQNVTTKVFTRVSLKSSYLTRHPLCVTSSTIDSLRR